MSTDPRMANGDPQDGTWPPRINSSLTTEFALLKENLLIQNEKITQLYVIQAEQTPFLWFGVLFVDSGLYIGSVIRFNMYIDETYPDCPCPKIVFHPIFPHPLVNPTTGELDTKNAFPDWNSNTRKLHELLLFVKRVIRQADEYIIQIRDLMFEHSTTTSPGRHEERRVSSEKQVKSAEEITSDQTRDSRARVLTSPSEEDGRTVKEPGMGHAVDAYDTRVKEMFTWFHHTLDFILMFVNDMDEFRRRVDDFKTRCNEQLLDRPALCGDDANAIVFSPWNREVHEPMRSCVLAGRFVPSSLFASYHKGTESVSFVPGHAPGLD